MSAINNFHPQDSQNSLENMQGNVCGQSALQIRVQQQVEIDKMVNDLRGVTDRLKVKTPAESSAASQIRR